MSKRNIVLSCHDDDSVLFMSYLSMREKLLHIVVLSSYIQPNRGEVGCGPIERADETKAACDVLGCEVVRLGLRDDNATEADMIKALIPFAGIADTVYAPAMQGGNVHHDMLARGSSFVFETSSTIKYRKYTTYTRTELYTTGDIEIAPTPEELELKARALACYSSQIRINRPHFDAVAGKSEWLMA